MNQYSIGAEIMDTRDYFAGQALIALIQAGEEHSKGKELKRLASLAYKIADAMLEEREMISQGVSNDTEQNNSSNKGG